MNVYMLEDVEKVGMAGQVVKVSDGYAQNFLFPRKLAIKVDKKNSSFFKNQSISKKVNAEVINTKAAMMAERIKSLKLTLKKRVHDEGKLYGAVSADEIVQAMKKHGFSVTKKQVTFDKSIKSIGEHKVTIKLSSKLKPDLTVKIVADKKL